VPIKNIIYGVKRIDKGKFPTLRYGT
jgi:hypothetical protein